jgi:hypothetical protein
LAALVTVLFCAASLDAVFLALGEDLVELAVLALARVLAALVFVAALGCALRVVDLLPVVISVSLLALSCVLITFIDVKHS